MPAKCRLGLLRSGIRQIRPEHAVDLVVKGYCWHGVLVIVELALTNLPGDSFIVVLNLKGRRRRQIGHAEETRKPFAIQTAM